MAPGPFTPVAFANGTLVSVGGQVQRIARGWSLRETGGAAAVVRLRDGDGSGVILATIALAANASSQEWRPEGMTTGNGIFMELVSGAVEGSVYA